MTSFGFSIGDVVLVANYAYSVYKSCKNAGDNFREITADINSLHSLLNALSNEYENPRSSFRYLPPDQEGQLAARLEDCKADLRSVKTILNDFRSLDTHHARYRDKLAFTSEKQAAIREKIVAHGARLQQFLSGTNVATFSRIENNTEVNGHILREIYVKVDMIQKDRFPCRRNAPERALSGNGLTLKNKTQKAITSSLRNASKITLTGDALAPENITPKAMTSGLRNTSKRTTSGGELASKNKTHKNNKTQKKHKLFSRHQSNLAHGISISVAEAIDGWRREIRHPSGTLIELHAYGPTNVRHFLEMYNYGLPYRTSPEAHGSLLLWIQVTDIEDASVGQLDQLEYEGGAYFARIKGEEGRRFESTHEEAVDLLAFGDKAISHSKLLSAGFKKRMNDVEKSPRRKVTPTEGKKRPRSPSHLS
ncbi:hypothetical protein J4E85_011242 [Alternaria conjuncta]|uniref:uncharacterized protein n=1 Tax=Alternaria conjuncta TaxID=181017 RepID=UPI00221FB887|nr:uncharacterized protein J4E85_011242 [Alternaria conjuncta]KAI4911333.1 hypothetical protein J4E85_011242 [Alternaria conjuncta]